MPGGTQSSGAPGFRAPGPVAPESRGRAGRGGKGALALLAGTQLLLIMDTAIINVALPSVGQDLGSGSAGLSWVANAFLITFGGLLLLGGRTADLLGHRKVFLGGLGVLGVASAVGGVAGSVEVLVAARAVQGVGAALAAAAAFALLLNLFPDGPGRHKALGAFAAMGGLGGVLGTVLGGVLTDLLGWRSTFWLNVLGALVLAVLALRLLDGNTRSAERGFDIGGALTATAGLGLVAFGLVGAGEAGWTSARTLGALAAGLVLLAAFAVLEKRITHPLVPPAVLRRPTLRLANCLSALAQMALFPMFFLVSLYLQSVLDRSPLHGGLGLLPLSLVVVATAPQAGRAIGRLGLRATMTLGFTLLFVGMLWLSLALAAEGTFFSTVLAPSLLLGVALPLVMVTTNVAATADAAPGETGLASGLVNTSQQFGSVLGLALLVAVATARTDALGATGAADETAGFKAALLVGAVLAGCAALLSRRLRLPAPVSAPPHRDQVGGARG
ncbi:MFS transporter [Streptomyces sp. NPDC059209]|uniref:MFS transporter n=1 Tax=Streptomyces sp. NPDC059209 TaxID=3346769 RepID=UPI0036AA4830